MPATILQKIVATKLEEIAAARLHVSEHELRAKIADSSEPRDFRAALSAGGPIRLIAEIKKASPSAGVIRQDFDPVAIAQIYEQHGAACISVLTDEPFFQGRLEYLQAVRDVVKVPILRKDFILDPYQLLEARAAGADAVLLIAECLDDSALVNLHGETVALGMTPLVELYEPENLGRVLDVGASVIGINNRNLHTFEVDINHTIRLRQEIPSECVVVGESGIRTRADVEQLDDASVDAILVGESLMRESDIGSAIDRMLAR